MNESRSIQKRDFELLKFDEDYNDSELFKAKRLNTFFLIEIIRQIIRKQRLNNDHFIYSTVYSSHKLAIVRMYC